MNIDVKTLFYIFSLGNLFIIFFFAAYVYFYKVKNNILNIFIIAKVLFAILWVLYALRHEISDFYSIILANIFLIFAIYLDLYCVTYVNETFNKKKFLNTLAIPIIFSIIFILISNSNQTIRIIVISFFVAFFYIVGGLTILLKANKTKIQIAVSYLCFIICSLFVYRMFWAYFEETALVVYPNSGVQLLTYLFLVLGSFIFPMILLIILKEKQEHDIIISNNSLKLLNKNKSNFFSIIAHDLKGPLGTYTKLIELLLNKHKEMPINQREEFLMKLHNSSTQMFNLLENLLKWSKVESGTTKVHPNDTVLKDIINPVALLMKNSLDLKNLDLVIAIPEEETVYCDYNMIMTVIRNLLSNAIKFTPNNGKITILSKKVNDNYLEIRIEDTGVGIPSKDLNSIFDLNSDLNTNGTNNETGTGLGLKLAKEYIKKNNGTIGIESVVNVGTTVWIHLPTKKTLQT